MPFCDAVFRFTGMQIPRSSLMEIQDRIADVSMLQRLLVR